MKKKLFIVLILILFVGIIASFMDFSKRRVVYQSRRLMVSVDGENVSKLPQEGIYYLTSYECDSRNTYVSWDKDEHQLKISNKNKKAGVKCYLTFESHPKLSDMGVGSFVKYSGNNGCDGDKCSGVNANYVDSNNKGYCFNKNLNFSYDGYRIIYSYDGSAYLVSAGSSECVCTDKDGNVGESCGNSLAVLDMEKHVDSLNNVALKYCNKEYAYQGVCSTDTVHNINQDDLNRVSIVLNDCYRSQNKKCGYTNDLIDIGSDYWIGNLFTDSSNTSFYWSSSNRYISSSISSFAYGIRPVIRLDKNVVVLSGNGTYSDPYVISNYTFLFGDIDKEKKTMKIHMSGVDIDKMCVSFNSAVCTNYQDYKEDYVLDISNAISGENVVYVYYKDSNDRVISIVDRRISLEI